MTSSEAVGVLILGAGLLALGIVVEAPVAILLVGLLVLLVLVIRALSIDFEDEE